jgi:hypothetical protein
MSFGDALSPITHGLMPRRGNIRSTSIPEGPLNTVCFKGSSPHLGDDFKTLQCPYAR